MPLSAIYVPLKPFPLLLLQHVLLDIFPKPSSIVTKVLTPEQHPIIRVYVYSLMHF